MKATRASTPPRQSFLIVGGDDSLVADIVGKVCEIDGASTLVRLPEQRRNVWPRYETVAAWLRSAVAAIANWTGASRKRCPSDGGPRVRILLPPAVSPVRT